MSSLRTLHQMSLAKLDSFTVERLLYDLGTNEVKQGPKSELLHNCLSPYHDDRNPSASYNTDSHQFNCWSCKVGGDVLKLVMMVRKLSYREAVKWLAAYTGIGDINEKDVLNNNLEWRNRARLVEDAVEDLYLKPEVKLPMHFIDDWSQAKPEIRKYLSSRKMTTLMMSHFGVGFCNEGWWEDRIIVPFIYWDKIVGFTARTIWDEEDYMKKFPDSDYYAKYKHKASTPIEEIILGLDNGYKKEDPVFVEGSFDWMRMRSYGINCYSTLSNNVSDAQVELIKKYFTGTIYVMQDNDQGGIQMIEKFNEKLFHSFPIKICNLPKGVKDPDNASKEQAKLSITHAKSVIELTKSNKNPIVTNIKRTL